MGIGKGKEKELPLYQRLIECSEEDQAPKGYIPVLVGKGQPAERFLLDVKLFGDPCIAVLLEMAADELGGKQEGVLRLTCDVEHFRRVVSVISKNK